MIFSELSDEADEEINAAIKERCQDRKRYQKQISNLENEVKKLNSCLAENAERLGISLLRFLIS